MRTWHSIISLIILILLTVLGLYFVTPKTAKADICYDTRVIYQYICTQETETCIGFDWRCRQAPWISCGTPPNVNVCPDPYATNACIQYCTSWEPADSCTRVGYTQVPCTDPPSCQFTGQITQCETNTSGSPCSEENLTYGCWGPGGASPSPGGSSPDPQINCGDGDCDVGEECSCTADCGNPPSCTNPSPSPTINGPPITDTVGLISACEGQVVSYTTTAQDADGDISYVQLWVSPYAEDANSDGTFDSGEFIGPAWSQLGTNISLTNDPSTCNGSTCAGTRQWTVPVTGLSRQYYVVSNATDTANHYCTGNTIDDGTTDLWGDANPPPYPGGSWSDCGVESRRIVTVAPCATGNIRVRAVQVPANSTCPFGSVAALPAGSVDYDLTLSSPLTVYNQTETLGDLNYTTSAHIAGTYTLLGGSIPGYYNSLNCFVNNTSQSGQTAGDTATLDTNGITWDVGYSFAQNWFQVAGGNVHSNRGVSVNLPQYGTQFLMSLPGGTGKSGLVSTVNPLNFGSNVTTAKEAVNAGLITTESIHPFDAANPSYYDYYWSRFQNEAQVLPNSNQIDLSTLADGGVYVSNRVGYVTLTPGSMSSYGNYFYNRKVVIFLSEGTDRLYINFPIFINNSGSFVVISKKNIEFRITHPGPPSRPLILANEVDLTTTVPLGQIGQRTPLYSGIYITDKVISLTESTFGPSLENGKYQAVMAGTFVADSFNFSQITLGLENINYPPAIFAYRADLWKNAPAKLKEIDLTWKEEAP